MLCHLSFQGVKLLLAITAYVYIDINFVASQVSVVRMLQTCRNQSFGSDLRQTLFPSSAFVSVKGMRVTDVDKLSFIGAYWTTCRAIQIT